MEYDEAANWQRLTQVGQSKARWPFQVNMAHVFEYPWAIVKTLLFKHLVKARQKPDIINVRTTISQKDLNSIW